VNYSEKKPLLEEDYLANHIIDTMQSKDIVKLQSEYKDFKYNNFVCNFRNQKIVTNKLQAEAEAPNAALENDHHLHPLAANPGNFPYPRWAGHEMQHLLKLDVDNNKHKTMKPAVLHKTQIMNTNIFH
jgi:hypothetical protein